jgi:hypothetical protein
MKRGAAALLILFFILVGCSGNQANEIKEKLLPSFYVNIPNIYLTVPPLPKVLEEEIPVGALKTPINMDSTIKAFTAGTIGADAVHFVKVRKLIVKLSNADTANNLANFESARMRIYNDTSSTDIAVIEFPESFSDSITVTPANSPDISNYLRGTTLNYNLYWKNRKITKKFLKLIVQVTLAVQ